MLAVDQDQVLILALELAQEEMSAFGHVLIVGAGIFGASTALELARLGHRVTIVDRSQDGYACENASSHDLNKIVRSDYMDAHYRDLGKKAIELWRLHPLYAPYFHEVGIFFYSGVPASNEEPWLRNGVENAIKPIQGAYEFGNHTERPMARTIKSPLEAMHVFPERLRPHLGEALTSFDKQVGYLNPQAGWVEARNATFAVLDEAKRLGVEVVSDATIVELVFASSSSSSSSTQAKPRVCGAMTSNGRTIHADRVVLAAGCWTPSLLETLHVPLKKPILRPSAHCVLTLKIQPDVARLFHGSPVTFNMDTGMYTFEPNPDGILKCAIHGLGSSSPDPRDSTTPAFPHANTNPHVSQMLKHIQAMFPVLQMDGPNKNMDVYYTRFCWYCDTADENFLIDFHPDVDNLLVASGDSGHALKFLPLMGRLITSKLLHIENDSALAPDMGLSAYQRRVFSFEHHMHADKTVNTSMPIDYIRISGIPPAHVPQPKL